MLPMTAKWTPQTWRSRPIAQVPEYPDPAKLAGVEERLRTFPPLVFAGEARRLMERLGEVAEVALAFGSTVALEEPDTVWVDVTGASHLAGGEDALALELASRIRGLGHAVRVAVSSGPRLAQAFARWGKVNREGCLVVPAARTALDVASLPVRALSLDTPLVAWLVRLGVHTLGDLAKLPRSAAAPRLGESAGAVLDLAIGRDDSPLHAYSPPAIPTEETTWEEPADGSEPLLFVLRGLTSRLGARLEGRGEAVQVVDLVILHDRAVARHRGVASESVLHFELSTPLWRAEELFRVIASRLTRFQLVAPSLGLRIEAHAITRALTVQLPLSRYAAGLGGSAAKGPETLPVVLAELQADVGKDRVGVLALEGSHRPEKRSRLVPVTKALLAGAGVGARRVDGDAGRATEEPRLPVPTRLLPKPVPFDAPLRPGATVSIDHRLYTVERITFESRLDRVEWWTKTPISRDYLHVWLRGGCSVLELSVYIDRETGVRKVQAIYD